MYPLYLEYCLGSKENVNKPKEKATWTSMLDSDYLWDLFSWLGPVSRLGEMVGVNTELASSCCLESYR